MRRIITSRDRIGPALEKHFHRHGVQPSRKSTYRGHDIFLAEGGPHFDAHPSMLGKDDAWMLSGYYLSVWAVLNGLVVLGRPLYFELVHDLDRSDGARKEGRIEAAEVDAKEHIDALIYAGHFKGAA